MSQPPTALDRQPSGSEASQAGAVSGSPTDSGVVLRGTTVAPGLVLGRIHCKDYELARTPMQRIPVGRIEHELNRFHRALVGARAQLDDLRTRLSGKVPSYDARILDIHVAYLKDSVFISDVENLILNEQMGLEAAIAKVITDFDRIFRLVQNETLRERAVDLRDVGIRVLRHLERDTGESEEPPPPSDYVLVARELSIVDMFNLSNDRVLGILTEEGGVTSHAAILARSMRIPTLTGISGLLGQVREGDFAIVDASGGLVRLNPDERVVAQYSAQIQQAGEASRTQSAALQRGAAAERLAGELCTRDGIPIEVSAVCGNLNEVEQAASAGLSSIRLYRTELLYLLSRDPPTREALVEHYAAVHSSLHSSPRAGGAKPSVTFRLLHADSSLGVGYLHAQREQNPGLGRCGVRALLANEGVLRRQIQAILLSSSGGDARLAVPFLTDCGELRRVREVIQEERHHLRSRGEVQAGDVPVGGVLETPASMLGMRDLAAESSFLVLSLDSLLQYLLAADRENHELSRYFATIHPFVLRALRKLVEVCAELDKPLSVFGASAHVQNLPALLGVGLRSFAIAPHELPEFTAAVRSIDCAAAAEQAAELCTCSDQGEQGVFVDAYRRNSI
jgi:phosphoenolpyruvate-protein kinase (PTS system EI component)